MKFSVPLLSFALVLFVAPTVSLGQALPRQETCWQVDDIRAGMKGKGRTVIKGTKIESFDAEVLGVMRNTNPGRDLVLCRLSGLNLDKTGVIAGMSGSPIFVEGKLLGAVAYAWAYGKEPIAGVTPFVQMHEFVAAYERRDLAEKDRPQRIGLRAPVRLNGRSYDSVTISNDFDAPQPAAADGIWLVPLRTPVSASGMSASALTFLGDRFARLGMVPMQGGSAAGNIPPEERNIPIEAGGALSVALITGDFDLSAIGTVTHVEGKRVYGWGHPFMSLGACELPLMTGYVHTIYPRQSLSFKMGSPLRTAGVINADVSTCIAGWLGRAPDMLPVKMTVLRDASEPRVFNVRVVRERQLMTSLVQTALLNCLDMEGDVPEEMTARIKVRINVEGREPLVLDDIYSGPSFAGAKGAQAMFAPVGLLLLQVSANQFQNLRIKSIEGSAEVQPGRTTADIEATELESETLVPGDTLRATVTLRPYKGVRKRVTLSLPLPIDLPDGSYTVQVGDDLTNVRAELRDNPHLNTPLDVAHLYEGLQLLASVKRTNHVMRLPTSAGGVAVNGKALPELPSGMVQLLSSSRRTGAQPITRALVARHDTGLVVQGNDAIRFQVTRHK